MMQHGSLHRQTYIRHYGYNIPGAQFKIGQEVMFFDGKEFQRDIVVAMCMVDTGNLLIEYLLANHEDLLWDYQVHELES